MESHNGWKPGFQVPKALRSEVVRPALLAQMEAASEYRVIGLIAPSGYGKTTLLAQYARAVQHPVVWLTLSPEVADPRNLAAVLVSALQDTYSGVALTKYVNTVRDESASSLLAHALALDLAVFPPDLRIVLDQTQWLSKASATWLENFIQGMPAGQQVLLAGYEGMPLSLIRLVAREEALVFGVTDLAFSANEAHAYLMARGVEEGQENAYLQVEGWPAGLSLLAATSMTYSSPAQLIQNLLDVVPADLCERLVHLAPLSLWSEEKAHALGLDVPALFLEEALRLGLPLTPVGHRHYRPHTLLSEALLVRLERDQALSKDIFLRAAAIELQQHNWLSALSLYARAGCWKELDQLLYQVLFDYMRRAEYHLAAQLLEKYDWQRLSAPLKALAFSIFHRLRRLPEAAAIAAELQEVHERRDPAVARALADWAIAKGNVEEALELVQQAVPIIQRPGITSPMEFNWTLRLNMARTTALQELNRLEEAWEIINEGLLDSDLLDLLSQAQLYHYSAQTARNLGHFYEWQRWAEHALRLYQKAGSVFASLLVVWEVAYSYGVQGKTAQGFTLCQEALDNMELLGLPQVSDMFFVWEMQGNLQLWGNDPLQALNTYRALGQVLEDHQFETFRRRLLAKQAECLYRLGEQREAFRLMNLIPNDSPGESSIPLIRGILEFNEGKLPQARDSFQKVIETPGSFVNTTRAKLYMAEIALLLNEPSNEWFTDLQQPHHAFYLPQLLQIDEKTLRGVTERLTPSPGQPKSSPRRNLDIFMLGRDFKVTLDGTPVHIGSRLGAELLLYLALYGQKSRDELIDALWNGENSRKNIDYFKVVVRRLRMALEDVVGAEATPLIYRNQAYFLSPELKISVDLQQLQLAFEQRAAEPLLALLKEYSSEALKRSENEWLSQLYLEVTNLAGEALQWLHSLNAYGEWPLVRYAEVLHDDPDAYKTVVQYLKSQGKIFEARGFYGKYVQFSRDYGIDFVHFDTM